MKILIVDDEFTSRRLLQKYLNHCGKHDIVVTGKEATEAFVLAWKDEEPYDLICLDIMMPDLNGQEALTMIRDMEKEMGIRKKDEVKVIMVTSLDDPKNVIQAFHKGGATSYVFKPVDREKLMDEVNKLGLLEQDTKNIDKQTD